jgi:O-antigen ligase
MLWILIVSPTMIIANEVRRPVRRGVAKRSRAGHTFGQGQSQILTSLAVGLLCLFVFSIPLENAWVLPGIGTVGRAIGLVACAVGLLAVLDRGRVRGISLVMILMAAYVIWASVTYFWSGDPELTIEIILSYVQLLVMVWLIWQLAPDRRRQVMLMQSYLAGTALSAAGTVLVTLTNGMSGRQGAFNMNPNDVGLRLALGLPIAIYLSAREKSAIKVWLYRLYMVLCAVAIFSTASRGALLALCAAGLMIPLTFRHWSARQRAAMAVVGVLGVVVAIALVPRSAWERLGTTSQEVSSGTMDSRTVIWHAGMDVFLEHPFVGVGIGSFPVSMERQVVTPWVAHNTFLSILVEQGVIGFSLFLMMFAAMVYLSLHMPSLERSLWLVVLLTWTIGVSAMTWEYGKPTWFLFAMITVQASSFPALAEKFRLRRALARRPAGVSQEPERSPERLKRIRDLDLKLQRAGIELPKPKQTLEPR